MKVLTKLEIKNTCIACGVCPIVSRNAINFSEVDDLKVREARVEADLTGKFDEINPLLTNIKIDYSKLTVSQCEQIKELCYVNAFDYETREVANNDA